MKDASNISGIERELKLEAIDLISKFDTTEPTAFEKEKIKSWRQLSEQHELAWVEAKQTWKMMSGLNLANIELEGDAGNEYLSLVTELLPRKALKITTTKKKETHTAWFSIAASVLFAFVLIFTFLQLESVSENRVVEYSNLRQQQHSVTLSDGTIAHLNFNSTIKVEFDADKRYLELIQGEAFFEVSKNPNRPFLVQVGSTQVEAVGTAFVVRKQGKSSASITVTEGKVKVTVDSQKGLQQAESVFLTINQSVTSRGQILGGVAKVEAKNMTAWHRGVLIFRDMPLSEALSEIERYSTYQISSELGEQKNKTVTGTFFINRLEQDLNSLINRFDLAIISRDENVLRLGVVGH